MFTLFLRNFRLAYQASRRYMLAITINNVIFAAVDLSSLLVFARLIDLLVLYLTKQSGALSSEVWLLFGLLVLRWLVLNVCSHFQDYLNNVYGPTISNHIDNIITEKLNALPTSTIESSDFQDRMNSIHTFSKNKFLDNVRAGNDLIASAARFVYALIALMINSPLLVILILAVSLPEVRYNLLLVKKMRELNEHLTRQRREQGYFTALTQDVTQYFNLKSYNLFPYFLKKIKRNQQEIFAGAYQIQRHNEPRVIAIGSIANLLGQFVPKGYYVWLTLTKRITIGQLQLFFQMIDQLYNSSYRLLASYLQIMENNIYVADLFTLLDLPEQTPTAADPSLDLSSITLEFRDVSFSYPNSKRKVLKQVSFTVGPGEKLALVGRNGAGKTTITKLLNKFYEPTEGVILVNGVDLRSIDGEVWRKAVSNLSQDVPRYFLTVRDNILLGDLEREPNEARYKRSLRRAHLDADVAALPKADNNMLGKHFAGGTDFSGGQWQKLSLARSFYRQAPLLIMDEPTSAIDAKAEHAIMQDLFERHGSQTQLIVSHRFSNIKQADQILVLDHGKLIEHGSHRELMQAEGVYASLYMLQSAAFQEVAEAEAAMPA